MPNFNRWYRRPNAHYALTVLVERAGQIRLTNHIPELRQAFRIVRRAYPFQIDGIVILPDHMHMVIQVPDTRVGLRVRLIKHYFCRQLPNTEYRSATRIKRNERGIWHRSFWERMIMTESEYRAQLGYIKWNPVSHGYVKSPGDWPFSSFSDTRR